MLDIKFESFPEIVTGRCRLRQISQNDASQLFRLRSDERIMQYIDREPWKSIEEASEMINRMDESFKNTEGISWAVCLNDGDDMIGMAGLWRIMKEHHRAEIGYTLLPEFWNRGLMSEVIGAITHYGFHGIKLHSIEANINPENIGSRKVLEKNGFQQEAYFRENFYFNGKFLDSVILSLVNK